MSSFKTAADVVRDHENVEHRKRVRAAIDEIYRAYPDLKRTGAASDLIERLCNEYVGEPVVPELWLFQEMARANPELVREQLQGVTVPLERQRSDLIAAIAELLSPESFKAERLKLLGLSKEGLEARLNQIRLTKKLQPYTADEIKQGLKAVRGQGTHELVLPAKWTRDALFKASSFELKRLIRLHGCAAVNRRLRGES